MTSGKCASSDEYVSVVVVKSVCEWEVVQVDSGVSRGWCEWRGMSVRSDASPMV